MAKTLMESIEDFIVEDKKYIKYGTGDDIFKVEINEDASLDDIHNAIVMIVDNVENQNFAYYLIDILEAYHILNLFTNIPVPMISDEIPDFEKCYDICLKLQLKYYLTQTSNIVLNHISMIEQNVWRSLEYKKSLKALIPYESLMAALNQFYEILDDLDKVVEAQKDIDIEVIANQLNEVTSKLSLVEEMKKENSK